ncbi:hypothetical protein SAMN02745975_03152 [Geosporobacter subterraneus DSM 17957]|jgi:hypothetical protein|uniref:Uncharacterized protein n=2 Tax=Geosporobacter TaxID=390805 RepID=A0A1D8GCU5_9FIRM|nr:hypothetical protein Gferi_03480 [Geosporobacter ferrireducens]SHJ88960.1 hypothetical protein SAMN02745975_03152 [Geosporobacter subterraneus DSM 17957]
MKTLCRIWDACLKTQKSMIVMGIKTILAEEYVGQLLGDKDFITSEDIPLDNDFDFVMSLMIAAEYS